MVDREDKLFHDRYAPCVTWKLSGAIEKLIDF